MNMNLIDMKPGRELDSLVAEKIFDAKLLRREKQPSGYEAFVLDKNLNNFQHPAVQSWMKAPNYSTDIAAAWEVVEKLNLDQWILDLFQAANEINSPWRAHFMKDKIRTNGYGKTAPLAICLAALAVKGIDSLS